MIHYAKSRLIKSVDMWSIGAQDSFLQKLSLQIEKFVRDYNATYVKNILKILRTHNKTKNTRTHITTYQPITNTISKICRIQTVAINSIRKPHY